MLRLTAAIWNVIDSPDKDTSSRPSSHEREAVTQHEMDLWMLRQAQHVCARRWDFSCAEDSWCQKADVVFVAVTLLVMLFRVKALSHIRS